MKIEIGDDVADLVRLWAGINKIDMDMDAIAATALRNWCEWQACHHYHKFSWPRPIGVVSGEIDPKCAKIKADAERFRIGRQTFTKE